VRGKAMRAAERMISNIDWDLLREQKNWLLEMRSSPVTGRLSDAEKDREMKGREYCTGLIHLLDWLQDFAVKKLHIPEDRVFGKQRKGEEQCPQKNR